MLMILPATSEQAPTILAIQKRAFEQEARLCDNSEIPPMTETLEAVLEHIVAATVLTGLDRSAIGRGCAGNTFWRRVYDPRCLR